MGLTLLFCCIGGMGPPGIPPLYMLGGGCCWDCGGQPCCIGGCGCIVTWIFVNYTDAVNRGKLGFYSRVLVN